MNAFKMNKNTKTGKSGETVHQASDGPSPMKWMSPTAKGPLSAFYSAGPVLSLKSLVQPKLTIGKPNDIYEQEADRVADQVMRIPEPKQSLVNGHLSLGKREKESSLVQRQSTYPGCPEKEGIQTKPIADQITPLVQRQEEEPEEEEEEEPVQTKPISDQITPLVQRQEEELEEEEEEETPIQAKFQSLQVPLLQRQEEEEETPIQAKPFSDKSSQVTPGLQNRIQSIRGGGQPLPKSLRNYFEPRFGADFSQVRVHTGNRAAEATKSVDAKAFTTGKDIVFGPGQYSPNTSIGKRLLAHELTHVVQQGGYGNESKGCCTAIRSNNTSACIQRTTFPNCRPADTPTVRGAVLQAIQDLNQAIRALNTNSPLAQHVRDALYLAFRSESIQTADSVRGNLGAIVNGLPNAAIECEYPNEFAYSTFCPQEIYGYVRWIVSQLGSGNIHVCTPTFTGMGAPEQAHGIVHEGSHRYNNTADRGFFSLRDCSESVATAGDPPTDRLDNADCYACIVHFIVRGVPANLRRDRQAYEGVNLRLVQNPAGIINLNSGTPKIPLFEIQGVPQNSGFVHRWVIEANSDRYLMWSDAGNPFRYGNYLNTYIPSGTRGSMANRRITSANVLCRTRLYREPGYRVSAPTVLLRLPINLTS